MQYGPIALCALSVISPARRSSMSAPRKMEKSVSMERTRGAVDGGVQPRTRRRDCSRRAIAELGAKSIQNGKILVATKDDIHSSAIIDPLIPGFPSLVHRPLNIQSFPPFTPPYSVLLRALYRFQPLKAQSCHNGVHRSSVHGDQAEVDLLHRLRWHYHC